MTRHGRHRRHDGPAWLALAALVAACGADIPPPRPLPPPPEVTEVEEPEEPIEEPTAESTYIYSPSGKRDPFRDNFLGRARLAVVDPETRRNAKLTALQKYEMDQLRLVFTMTGDSRPMATILDPRGRAHHVHIGDFVGKNWGKVSHIGREEITITETIADAQNEGVVYPVYVPMRMPKTDAEKNAALALGDEEDGS